MNNIQKNFIWQGKRVEIKHSILFNGYEKGSIKNVDLRNKVISMQCFSVRILFKYDFYDSKLPILLIAKHLGMNFKFHNYIDINNDLLSKCSSFYQDIFMKWINNYTAKPILPSMILPHLV